MAGTGQAPTPYDGMGTPTRWDASGQDQGAQPEAGDAVRAERFAPGAPRRHDESEDFVRKSLRRYYQ
jgi:hypothetical protein